MNTMTLTFPRLGFGVTEVKKTLIALLMVAVLLIGTACDWASWTTRAEEIITAATPALEIVLQLLPLLGVKVPPTVATTIQAWEPQVEADLTFLNGLLTDYQKTSDATAKSNLLAKIDGQVQTTATHLNGIFATLHVLDKATQDKITAIVMTLDSALQEVAALVAAAQGKTAQAKAKIAKVSNPVTSAKAFKKQFNATLHAPTGDVTVDVATAKLTLK